LSASTPDRRGPRRRHSLRRRIFLWFGAAIVLATLTAAAVFWATRDVGLRDVYQRSLDLAGQQFARVWHSDRDRQQLAHDIAQAYSANVELRDVDGTRVGGMGSCRSLHGGRTIHVVYQGKREGSVVLCWNSATRTHGGTFWLGLGAAVFVLWALAGALARRLTRPLEQLEHTARQLGDGDLKCRAELDQDAVGEVGQLASAFNEMAQRLEDQVAAQRELLAAVSHEVRSPLGRMRVLLELGRTKGLDPERLGRLEREVAEIDELVAQLLVAARLDFDEPNRRPLRVGDFVAELLERSGEEAVLHDETDNREVCVDPTLIGRALSNLLGNARTHAAGATRVRLRVRESELCLEVIDEGPGLGNVDAASLFEPFCRAHQGERSGSALGLGLALVARVARAHGGSAYAHNRDEGGACVGFSVSIAQQRM